MSEFAESFSSINKSQYSLTKIVATIGPASEDPETLREMIKAGMNVARINCSHGDWEERNQRINNIREISRELNRPVGILVDLQGPKIRTGSLPDDGLELTHGDEIILTTSEKDANYTTKPYKVHIRNYPELPREVKAGQRILLDDGLLRLQVISISDSEVECTATVGGTLKKNKGVNLPESEQLGVEAITPKDKEDLIGGVKAGADFIALSFVRTADDIKELKRLIEAAGPKTPVKTIAKIEKPQAVDHLDSILEEVDGVMVARGDLGVELEPEKVPLIQKEIIRKANLTNRFVITATQMMDSMIRNPFPTRAEVSDVANAIIDGTDAVMLSGETAAGSYPIMAIDYMRKIALEVEENATINVEVKDLETLSEMNIETKDNIAIAQSVATFSKMPRIRTIVSFSCSGKSVQLISKLKPKSKIIACTTYSHTYNYLSIVWGVTPIYFDKVNRTTQTFVNLEDELLKQGLVEEGETIIVTGGIPIAARGPANFVKLHNCDGSMKENIKKLEEDLSKNLDQTLAVN